MERGQIMGMWIFEDRKDAQEFVDAQPKAPTDLDYHKIYSLDNKGIDFAKMERVEKLEEENAALRARWKLLRERLKTRCFSDAHTITQVLWLIEELEQND